ncbi:TIM-barrel domain-containing protein [Longispora sp. NPDC051575]|uniref:TIM-barrel domain-containing protein n=1 Tax=Longispora sp. NPDC051575 TaxID=3154943 RepID=UPI0034442AE1
MLARTSLATALTVIAVLLATPPQLATAAPGDVVDGKARFQVLSPTLIRMEYAGDTSFENRPTFNAANRAMPAPAFTTAVEGGYRIIRTGKLTMRYLQNSGPFTAANVAVDLTVGTQPVTARPYAQGAGACAHAAGCEAEKLTLTGGASVASDHSGSTGGAFVAGLTGTGATIGWSASPPAAGSYAVQFRYANSTGGDGQNTTRTMTLNAGGTTRQVSLPVTANWDTWAVSSTTVTLPAGSSAVSLACGTADSCNVNIDSVAVTPVGATYPSPTQGPASANLGGWRRGLDGQNGPVPMADGLLSRDGSYLLDDTTTAIINTDGTETARPGHSGQPYQDGYFFGYGHDYRQGLKDLRDLTGPAVLLPRSAFGNWYSRYQAYKDSDYRDTLIPGFRNHQVPLDTLVVDTDWKSPNAWNGWEWNQNLFPDPKGFMTWAAGQGLKVSLNVHPSIATGDPKYSATSQTAGGTLVNADCYGIGACKVFDFRNPAHLRAYFDLHTAIEQQQGQPIWWLDQSLGEAAPTRAGMTADSWINARYAAREDAAGRRGFVLARIGGNGSDYSTFTPPPTGAWGEHRSAIHFTGDTSPSWSMLSYEAYFTTREGSGIGMPYVSHDITGFNGAPAADLYARWIQFGAFQPILRIHSSDTSASRLPWDVGGAGGASAEKFLRLREALIPYTYTLARQATDTGLPIVRGLYLNYPEHNEAYAYDRQYLYGDDVLVAPVTTAGTGTVNTTVWFPPGTWTDYFTGRTYTGPSTAQVATTLDTMPVFLRSGGIMPTRTDYVDHANQKPLNQVTLDVAAGGNGTFGLYEDAGEGNAYRSGESANTPIAYTDSSHQLTISPRQGTFPGAVANRAWTAKFRNVPSAPSQVTVNGAAVTGHTYNATTRTLTVTTNSQPATATTTIAYTPGMGTSTGPVIGVGSNRCVDIPNANPADGSPLQLYDSNGSTAQTWSLNSDGTLRALGKCADVAGGAGTDGAVVQLYTCSGTPAQKWNYNATTKTLTSMGKCLDANGGATTNGTKLIIWTCHGGPNQQWNPPA